MFKESIGLLKCANINITQILQIELFAYIWIYFGSLENSDCRVLNNNKSHID